MTADSHRTYGSLEGSDYHDHLESSSSRTQGMEALKAQDRSLGLWDGIALVVGLQLGSGIFSSPSAVYNGADTKAGAFALWLLGGLIAWTGAKSAAELGVRAPFNGGLLDYLALCYGWHVACIVSWLWIFIVKPCGSAILCIVISRHALEIMGSQATGYRSIGRIVAVISILTATWTNWSGVERSRTMVRVFMGVKLMTMASVILLGVYLAATSNRKAEEMPNHGTKHTIKLDTFDRLGHGLFEALWAYSGWESVG